MLAENVNRASAGFKKKSLVFRKIALESKLPPVLRKKLHQAIFN